MEDDESLGFITKDNLEGKGFEVKLCVDGEEGIKAFNSDSFDLCLLDVMLPKIDGLDLASMIRSKDQAIPIIFLTAKGLQEDKIQGFKAGGDDYVTKPFSMEELVYRIESCLKRRYSVDVDNETPTFGGYHLDLYNFLLCHPTENQKLTRRESEIIKYLVDRVGVVVPREELLLALWGDNDYFKGRSLDVFISKIRKYLRHDPLVDIENHHGVGFKMVLKPH